MNTEWNLSIMYSGLDDPALQEDMNKLVEANQAFKAAVEKASTLEDKEKAELILSEMEKYNKILFKIFDFLQLRQACNTEDGQNMALINKVMNICHRWEHRTGMGLSFDEITEIFQKDVNNYCVKFSLQKEVNQLKLLLKEYYPDIEIKGNELIFNDED